MTGPHRINEGHGRRRHDCHLIPVEPTGAAAEHPQCAGLPPRKRTGATANEQATSTLAPSQCTPSPLARDGGGGPCDPTAEQTLRAAGL